MTSDRRTSFADVIIDPKDSVLVEIAGAELQRTDQFSAGYCMRFPRVIKFREDKVGGAARHAPTLTCCFSSPSLLLLSSHVLKRREHRACSHPCCCRSFDIPVHLAVRVRRWRVTVDQGVSECLTLQQLRALITEMGGKLARKRADGVYVSNNNAKRRKTGKAIKAVSRRVGLSSPLAPCH